MKTKITDLEEMFKEWAWGQYMNTSQGLLARIFKGKLKYKHARIELKWDGVKMWTLKPEYEELPSNKSVIKVIVESEYENETSHDQTHSFRTERDTVSTATFSLNKGFSKSVNAGLEITLPPEMLEGQDTQQGNQQGQHASDVKKAKRKQMATASFGNTIHVDTEEGNTVEKSLKWRVDTTIVSKSKKLTIASLEVEEANTSYNFSVKARLKGRIVAVITDSRGEGKLIQTVEGDVATVLNDINNGGSGRLRDAEFDMGNRFVLLPVEGSVVFKYGVSQKVKVAYGRTLTEVESIYPNLN